MVPIENSENIYPITLFGYVNAMDPITIMAIRTYAGIVALGIFFK